MKRIILHALFLFVSCGTVRNSNVGNDATGNSRNDATAEMIDTASLVAVPAPGQLWGKTYGDYVFHDDFYYFRNKTEKVPLVRKPDHYGLVIEYDSKDTVMNILSERGFTVVRDIGKRGFPLERSPYCYYLVVKGNGRIDDLPHIIFWNHMYDAMGDIIGVDPTFLIATSGSAEEEDRLMRYAKEHKVIFTDSWTTRLGGRTYYYFKCTNESSGNPTEMANWFLERGGFSTGSCDWRDVPVHFD